MESKKKISSTQKKLIAGAFIVVVVMVVVISVVPTTDTASCPLPRRYVNSTTIGITTKDSVYIARVFQQSFTVPSGKTVLKQIRIRTSPNMNEEDVPTNLEIQIWNGRDTGSEDVAAANAIKFVAKILKYTDYIKQCWLIINVTYNVTPGMKYFMMINANIAGSTSNQLISVCVSMNGGYSGGVLTFVGGPYYTVGSYWEFPNGGKSDMTFQMDFQ